MSAYVAGIAADGGLGALGAELCSGKGTVSDLTLACVHIMKEPLRKE